MYATSSTSSVPNSNNNRPQSIRVSYCTDVEGNFDYWCRYLAFSRTLGGVPGSGELYLRDCDDDADDAVTHFVYGGDSCDRGCGDLRVLRDLVHLKRKYRDRVHLIIGNRDANKMRLFFELKEELLNQPPCVYWLGDKEKVGWDAPDATTSQVHTMSERLQWVSMR